jgi:hypothetical protein
MYNDYLRHNDKYDYELYYYDRYNYEEPPSKFKKQVMFEYIFYYLFTFAGMIGLNEYKKDIDVNLEQRILLYIFVFTIAPFIVIILTLITAILFGNYDDQNKRFVLRDQEKQRGYKYMLYLGFGIYLLSLSGFLYGYFTKNATPIHFAYIVIAPTIVYLIIFLMIPFWNCISYIVKQKRNLSHTNSVNISNFEERFL